MKRFYNKNTRPTKEERGTGQALRRSKFDEGQIKLPKLLNQFNITKAEFENIIQIATIGGSHPTLRGVPHPQLLDMIYLTGTLYCDVSKVSSSPKPQKRERTQPSHSLRSKQGKAQKPRTPKRPMLAMTPGTGKYFRQ